jgi:DNA modification methylase
MKDQPTNQGQVASRGNAQLHQTTVVANGRATLLVGHCLDVLKTLSDGSVQCCVTSPPYWGLRDYGLEPTTWGGNWDCVHSWERDVIPASNGRLTKGMREETLNPRSATRLARDWEMCSACGAGRGCLGLEPTPDLYVIHLVEVFREVMRVLTKDGTLWLNLGDCFAGSWGDYWSRTRSATAASVTPSEGVRKRRLRRVMPNSGFLPPQAVISQSNNGSKHKLKKKDLIGVPWMVAFALRDAGWYLRSDIIWHKSNCMPESVRDRPTRSHEYLFLLTKSERYYYDKEAIAEPLAQSSIERMRQTTFDKQSGGAKDYGGEDNSMARNRSAHRALVNLRGRMQCSQWEEVLKGGKWSKRRQRSNESNIPSDGLTRNKRDVWSVTTAPYKQAHFATYPPELIRPCIRAGCPKDGVVLDPFMGSGTTGQVALEEGCCFIGIDQQPDYIRLAAERIASG